MSFNNPKRDYVLYEPNFQHLQETYLQYFKHPIAGRQLSKEERLRRRKLEKKVKERKEELLEAQKEKIAEMEERLEDITPEDGEVLDALVKLNKLNLEGRIADQKQLLNFDLSRRPAAHKKRWRPSSEPVIEWSNPPKYELTAPRYIHLKDVQNQYSARFAPERQQYLAEQVARAEAGVKEYEKWQHQV